MTAAGATAVCVLTPPGRGAVAVVGVAGPRAAEAVDACFLPASGVKVSDQPPGAIRLGRWLARDGEELIVVRRPPDAVEVHCHGGDAAVRGVVRALAAAGCVEAEPTPQASPPTAAAALAMLGQATTLRAAAVLWDQAEGALDRALRGVRDRLDRGECDAAGAALDRLLRHAPVGLHLVHPWRVVIAGSPNVGKSSLANALLGYERSVVFDQPGTTRDVVASRTAIDGWPVELSDTAGLRDATDAVEREGVSLAIERLRRADVVIELSEGPGEGGAGEGAWFDAGASGARRIAVASKCDTGPPLAAEDPRLATSARTGQGIDALLRAIAGVLPAAPPAGEGAPFEAAMVDRIDSARRRCGAGDPQGALRLLAPLID
ncbi:tRNA modification GTPase MnmE [Pirellulimonas nuda]|uniref:tRNA modification GTPase MnmE n=1 Tax=Pirellulimonas nuda TaxID=2528009 RepID=A0A518DIV5_9BACT|nr:GTPase [Pirellulimonas nuda]QDU91404.1 tRNA modification GTPase MnmE [Pirellulimonas nuda]